MEGGRERERERERERKRENKLTNSHHFPLPVWVNFRSILRQLWKGAVNFFYCRRLSNEESMECSHIISACSPEAVQIKAPRLTVYPVTARRTMHFLQGYEHQWGFLGDMHISQETHRAQSTPAGASGKLSSPGAL